ncbi:hypothetical protein ACWOMK_02055 [Bacillus thuringiensis]
MTNQLTEQLIKMNGPSPEALKLVKAFLMRTSVPRIAAQRIKERSENTSRSN